MAIAKVISQSTVMARMFFANANSSDDMSRELVIEQNNSAFHFRKAEFVVGREGVEPTRSVSSNGFSCYCGFHRPHQARFVVWTFP